MASSMLAGLLKVFVDIRLVSAFLFFLSPSFSSTGCHFTLTKALTGKLTVHKINARFGKKYFRIS